MSATIVQKSTGTANIVGNAHYFECDDIFQGVSLYKTEYSIKKIKEQKKRRNKKRNCVQDLHAKPNLCSIGPFVVIL